MSRTKNAYRIFLVLSFIAINALIIFGIGAVLSYLSTGADKSTMLHLEQEVHDVYLPKVQWTDTLGEGRPISKQILNKIERDYKRAWYVKNLAFRTNDPDGLKDYYTDSVLVKLKRIVRFNKEENVHIRTTTLTHHPDLEFFSADGQLVVFRDNNVTRYSQTFMGDTLLISKKDTTNYRVIMLLEDGFWRIRHLMEIKSDTLEKAAENKIGMPLNLDNIRGVNYYPKDAPWNMFGDNFDSVAIGKDIKLIRHMGLNMIRIFIPYEDFGKNKVDQSKLAQVGQVLDFAEKAGIKVMITLFDFYGNYDITDWTLTHRHAEVIVETLKNHPALLAWDIKNEPDLDFENRKKYTVNAWLSEMIAQVKGWDTTHPVTIGWSSAESANNLSNKVDIVSFHYYEKLSLFTEKYRTLKSNLPANKPIFLQEYGISSYGGLWKGFMGSESKQADYYKEIQGYIKQENIPFAFWGLYDFEEVPTAVVGRLPWRRAPQKYYGCIDTAGNKKQSYSELAQ